MPLRQPLARRPIDRAAVAPHGRPADRCFERFAHGGGSLFKQRVGSIDVDAPHNRPRGPTDLGPEPRKSWMHPRSQTLLIGDPQQEGRQEAPLFLVQCAQEPVLVLTGNAANGLKNLFPSTGQLEQVDTTVSGVFESLDQSPALQLVDERHQPAWEQSEPLRDILLAGSRRAGNNAQQTGVRGCQSKRTKPLGKLCRCMRSDLRDEKGGRLSRL